MATASRIRILLLALAGLAAATAAQAQHYSPAASGVLMRARAASGGEHWNGLRGWHEVGTVGGGAYERWIDPVRYGDRVELTEAAGKRVRGFNGTAEWTIAPTGEVTGRADRATVARARTEAFFAAAGYFFPSRFAADGELVGGRQAGGRSFDVVRVHPMGGLPRELWFDRRTRLLARIVDRNGAQPSIVELSDYRRSGPVMAPHRMVVDADDPARRLEVVLQKVTIEAPDRALFSLARPPGMAAPPVAAPIPHKARPSSQNRRRRP